MTDDRHSSQPHAGGRRTHRSQRTSRESGLRTRDLGILSEPTTDYACESRAQRAHAPRRMWFLTVADFTISSGDYIRPYRSPWGAFPIKRGLESSAQSYIYGDVLELDDAVGTSAHRLTRASTSGSTCTSLSIVGISAGPASSVMDASAPYYEANPSVEFWGRTKLGVLGSSCVGNSYGLARDSTKNVWLVDFGNKVDTSVRVIVTELVDAVGDSGGAVLFHFGSTNSTESGLAFF